MSILQNSYANHILLIVRNISLYVQCSCKLNLIMPYTYLYSNKEVVDIMLHNVCFCSGNANAA